VLCCVLICPFSPRFIVFCFASHKNGVRHGDDVKELCREGIKRCLRIFEG
jgi:hypothetical protein